MRVGARPQAQSGAQAEAKERQETPASGQKPSVEPQCPKLGTIGIFITDKPGLHTAPFCLLHCTTITMLALSAPKHLSTAYDLRDLPLLVHFVRTASAGAGNITWTRHEKGKSCVPRFVVQNSSNSTHPPTPYSTPPYP